MPPDTALGPPAAALLVQLRAVLMNSKHRSLLVHVVVLAVVALALFIFMAPFVYPLGIRYHDSVTPIALLAALSHR